MIVTWQQQFFLGISSIFVFKDIIIIYSLGIFQQESRSGIQMNTVSLMNFRQIIVAEYLIW